MDSGKGWKTRNWRFDVTPGIAGFGIRAPGLRPRQDGTLHLPAYC